MADKITTEQQQTGAKPAPWIFLVLSVATALSAAISLSMIAAPQMLATHGDAGFVAFFLAVGAVYLGMPVTWILGLAVIAMYPRQGGVATRGTLVAVALWTGALAAPYVSALLG